MQGSKAFVYDPPVADELNTVFSAGKLVRISTVKGKCIDGCTEADFGLILCPLTTRKEGIFCFSCSSAPEKPEAHRRSICHNGRRSYFMLTLDKVYKASHVLKEVIRETDLI